MAKDDPLGFGGSMGAGTIRIQQGHNQRGKGIYRVTLPMEVVKHMGWHGGMFLTYYPTKARELVLVPQGQALTHHSPDYDGSWEPPPQPDREVRPGSVEAAIQKSSRELDAIETSLSRVLKGDSIKERERKERELLEKGEREYREWEAEVERKKRKQKQDQSRSRSRSRR